MDTDNQHHGGPTMSDHVGHSPTESDIVRPSPTMSAKRGDAHTLTSREALKLFEQSGLARSQRSIERYCKQEKLDCFFDPDEQRYYVTPASTETLIKQLKEIQTRHEQSPLFEENPDTADIVRQGSTSTYTPPQHGEYSGEQTEKLKTKITELEGENFLLKVDNKAREQLLQILREQINTDRNQFVDELVKHTKRVGELETKLLQLEAPQQKHRPIETATVKDAEFIDVTADGAEVETSALARDLTGPTG